MGSEGVILENGKVVSEGKKESMAEEGRSMFMGRMKI